MFLRILAVLLIALPLSAQVARPKLNGLEQRKGQMILAAQADAQTQLTQANAALTSATNAEQKNLAQASMDTKSPQEALAKSAAQRLIFKLTQQEIAAKNRQAQAQLRLTQLGNQLADWESSTLQAHAADPAKYKVAWTQGQIVAK